MLSRLLIVGVVVDVVDVVDIDVLVVVGIVVDVVDIDVLVVVGIVDIVMGRRYVRWARVACDLVIGGKSIVLEG